MPFSQAQKSFLSSPVGLYPTLCGHFVLNLPHMQEFAVVGASTNKEKYGTKVLKWYINRNKTVTPIHPVRQSLISFAHWDTGLFVSLLFGRAMLSGVLALTVIYS